MKPGYIVDHNMPNDSLGEDYQVASVSNFNHFNEVKISYWNAIESVPSHGFVTAIFKIKPKTNNHVQQH